MRAAAGRGFIVVLRNEVREGFGEFAAEGRPIRCRPEANLGIERKRRQAFTCLCRTTNKVGHLADDPRAQGDEIACGQPVDFAIRIRGCRAKGLRRNDVGSRGRYEQPFRQPAPLAFLGEPHQPVRLKRVQVVGDFLPSQANPQSQRCRRGGLGKLREESTAHWPQGHGRGGRIIDDEDVEHGGMIALTIIPVKERPYTPGVLRSLICACVAVVAVSAQQPVFRSKVQFVAIDVVVTDKQDRPVADLTKDDFEVRENGARQTITDFTFVSVPLANRVVDVDAPPLPPSDIGSNAASLRSSRAIVVFVDDTSLSAVLICELCVDVMVALKQALTRFLQTLTPDDQVAIVWQSRSDLSQDFTNDIPRLIETVNSRKAAMGPIPIDPRTPPWRPRVDSLKFAVAALAGSSYARRAIVFVGARACNPVPGLSQAGLAGFEDVECRDLYERARNANVPIYALDPRVNPETRDPTMAELAINTGGRHFLQQPNPLSAVEQIVLENGSFYTLGFYPEPMLRDGKYHKLDVTVKRPGLIVRSRERYLADTASPPASNPKRDMTKALGSGLDDPSLPIRAFVAPLAPALRGMTRTLVTLEMTYPVPRESAKLQDELRIGILALSPDAKIKASFQRPVTFTGAWKPTASGTFVLNETIDLPSDALTVRAGITSSALARTGTAHVSIDVPDYRKRDLQLSPLVLGSARQPVDAAIGLDIVRSLVPFQPTTARTFMNTDRLRVFALVYAGSTAESFAAELQLDGRPLFAQTLPARNPALGRREANLDTFVPLTGLAAGSHTLTVTVIDGKQRAQRAIPFEIAR